MRLRTGAWPAHRAGRCSGASVRTDFPRAASLSLPGFRRIPQENAAALRWPMAMRPRAIARPLRSSLPWMQRRAAVFLQPDLAVLWRSRAGGVPARIDDQVLQHVREPGRLALALDTAQARTGAGQLRTASHDPAVEVGQVRPDMARFPTGARPRAYPVRHRGVAVGTGGRSPGQGRFTGGTAETWHDGNSRDRAESWKRAEQPGVVSKNKPPAPSGPKCAGAKRPVLRWNSCDRIAFSPSRCWASCAFRQRRGARATPLAHSRNSARPSAKNRLRHAVLFSPCTNPVSSARSFDLLLTGRG